MAFPTKNQLEELKKINKQIKSSGGNVKVVPQSSAKTNKKLNEQSTTKTSEAKSGKTAKQNAKELSDFNKAAKEFGISKPKKVKIDSNPAPGRTRIGPLAGAARGGMGGGMNWQTK